MTKNNKPNYVNYLFLIVLLLFVLLLALFLKSTNEKKEELVAFKQDLSLTEINDPRLTGTQNKFEHTCLAGKTVFESLLTQLSNVEFKEYSFGKQITTIEGVEQSGSKYWLYTVDGKEASVGADTYVCSGGEKILWELK